jgi:hypothetical protein
MSKWFQSAKMRSPFDAPSACLRKPKACSWQAIFRSNVLSERSGRGAARLRIEGQFSAFGLQLSNVLSEQLARVGASIANRRATPNQIKYFGNCKRTTACGTSVALFPKCILLHTSRSTPPKCSNITT